MPIIRKYVPLTDHAVLTELIRKELLPFSHTVSPQDGTIIRELPRRLQIGITHVACLTRMSAPFAFIHYIPYQDIIYVDMLVTHPQHRNRKWGKKLMAKCEADAIARQCRAIILYVDQSNEKAMQFYTKLGYSAVSFQSELRCYEMVKPLMAQHASQH